MNRLKPSGSVYNDLVRLYNDADSKGKKKLASDYHTTVAALANWIHQGDTDKPQHHIDRGITTNVPLKLITGDVHKTVAFKGDTHHPYQDVRALAIVDRILKDIQPDYLVYIGDECDFYQISTFDKDPSRVDGLQGDINSTKRMFERDSENLKAEKVLLTGNHEHRWQKFLWTQATALSSLKCLNIEDLFGLIEYDIKLIGYERGLLINGTFLALHGDISSIHSGYTAKRMYEKHGGSGIAGHCHRGGSFYKRDRFGFKGWYENFCLCSLEPDWIMHPNWVQGFTLVHFMGKKFLAEQIPIIDGVAIYGGKLYD